MSFVSDWWDKVRKFEVLKKEPEKTVLRVVDETESEEPQSLGENADNLAARIAQNEADVKATQQKHIVCNGKKIPINWPKVVLWTDPNGLSVPKKCFKEQKSRNPTMFVAHWDVCLSTASMVRVIVERGLSVHFGIDNDGTIFQLLDTKEIAWHAAGVNTASVGVEICNGVLPKFNQHYPKVGLPLRTMQNYTVHGKEIGPFLGFYPEQVKAFKALTLALNQAHGIPFKTPRDQAGKYLQGVSQEVVKNTFKGVIGHFHVTTNKTDPGNLPIDKITEDLANGIKD